MHVSYSSSWCVFDEIFPRTWRMNFVRWTRLRWLENFLQTTQNKFLANHYLGKGASPSFDISVVHCSYVRAGSSRMSRFIPPKNKERMSTAGRHHRRFVPTAEALCLFAFWCLDTTASHTSHFLITRAFGITKSLSFNPSKKYERKPPVRPFDIEKQSFPCSLIFLSSLSGVVCCSRSKKDWMFATTYRYVRISINQFIAEKGKQSHSNFYEYY